MTSLWDAMPSRSHPKASSRRRRVPWPRIAVIAGVAVLVLALYLVGKHWLTIDSLRSHREALQQFVAAHYWASLSVLCLAAVALVAVNMPISPFLEMLSGAVFGLWVATGSMVVATSIGSVPAMLMVRYLVHDLARRWVRRHPKARKLLAGFDRHQGSYLLFLRWSPGIPLWLANIVCGLTDISVLRFSLLTLLGVLPDTFVFANIGANLAKVKSAHDLLSPGIVAALVLLGLLALVPVAVERLRRRRK